MAFPALTHPAYPDVAIARDIASQVLHAGMAVTLAVFQASYIADRIAAAAAGTQPPGKPRMAALCFTDTGDSGSLLHCDFTGPAAGTGPPQCVLMPPLSYFRRAKQLFADEWFTTMVTGEVA